MAARLAAVDMPCGHGGRLGDDGSLAVTSPTGMIFLHVTWDMAQQGGGKATRQSKRLRREAKNNGSYCRGWGSDYGTDCKKTGSAKGAVSRCGRRPVFT